MKIENGSVPDKIVKEDPKKTDWSKLTVAQRFDLSVKRAMLKEQANKYDQIN